MPLFAAQMARQVARHHRISDREEGEFPLSYHIGAVLVKGGSILSVGWNTRRNQNAPIRSEHAEMRALRLCKNPHGASLYVARAINKGWSEAKPCYPCVERLYESGIRQIHYTGRTGVYINTTCAELLSKGAKHNRGNTDFHN